jgi:NDP-sugar pyrophosphorylase family protein
MKSLTDDHQKCMLCVGRRPILEYVLDMACEGVPDPEIIIATGYRYEQILDHFGQSYRGASIRYAHCDQALEDRRRLLLSEPLVCDQPNFVFLAGDVVCHSDHLKKVIEIQSAVNGLGTLSGASLHQPAPTHGVMEIEGNRVVTFEHPFRGNLLEGRLREMGVSCLSAKVFEMLRTAPLELKHVSQVLAHALEKDGQALFCEPYYGKWWHYAEESDLAKYPSDELPLMFQRTIPIAATSLDY